MKTNKTKQTLVQKLDDNLVLLSFSIRELEGAGGKFYSIFRIIEQMRSDLRYQQFGKGEITND